MGAETKHVEIYALLQPDTGEVRYIGKANDSHVRLKSHLRDCKRRHTPVYCWIRKLMQDGKIPGLRVIERVAVSDWPEAEKKAILAHQGDRLLNLAEGGTEPFCATEVRAENGRAVSKAIQADPQRQRIWYLKLRIGQHLRHGNVSEETKEKLRYCARKRPDLFGCWANI